MAPPLLNPSSFITANPLEDFSIRYANSLDKYAALRIFLPHVTSKKTGQFYSYSKDNLKIKTLDAPSGTEAKTHSYSVTKRTFTCAEKAVKALVLGKDARDFDRPVADLDQEAAQQNMDALMIELEDAAYTKISTTASYPSALLKTLVDSSTRWSDAQGDPLDNIREMRQAVFEKCGKRPNKMAHSQKTMDIVKINPSIVDRIKYTGQQVTEQILRMLFELDEIVISDVIKNTANDGAADSLAELWGDEALLFYADPAARLKSMTFGKAFLANRMYVKTLDKPELGRELGAHEIESGWEYVLEPAATVSDTDTDFVAGALIDNVY